MQAGELGVPHRTAASEGRGCSAGQDGFGSIPRNVWSRVGFIHAFVVVLEFGLGMGRVCSVFNSAASGFCFLSARTMSHKSPVV